MVEFWAINLKQALINIPWLEMLCSYKTVNFVKKQQKRG
jgi:hypothetical protein